MPEAPAIQHLLDLDPDALEQSWQAQSQTALPGFRVNQVFEWIYRHHARSFAEMSSLSGVLREQLAGLYRIHVGEAVADQDSADGTRKLLLRWPDGGTTECVLIPGDNRRSACISTQVGCPVQCTFCASGVGGLERNLTGGQIAEQALRLAALCAEQGQRLSHIVVMGLGEPLANYASTLQALRTINAEWGLNIAARRITLSTVGLPNQMRRLAEENLQITLALSLHAPNDALRRSLIPWAQRVSIAELVDACRYYFERTGREVTLEYILLGGVNDRPDHARQLVQVSRKMRSNVNLIAYNPVDGLSFNRPGKPAVQQFLTLLREAGVNAHVRASRGLDIDAACGQLRRRHQAAIEIPPPRD